MKEFFKNIFLNLRVLGLKVFSIFLLNEGSLPNKNDVTLILVIRIDGIGDSVLSLPAIKALKNHFPLAEISVLINKQSKDIFTGIPYINEVLIYGESPIISVPAFDIVFDFYDGYSLDTAILAYKSKALCKVGFNVKGRGIFFDYSIFPAKSKPYKEVILDLVKVVGVIPNNDDKPELIVSQEDNRNALIFLTESNFSSNDLVIAMHPGGTFWTQRWMAKRFGELAQKLVRQHNAKIILIGSKEEKKLLLDICDKVHSNFVTSMGNSLRHNIALIKNSSLMICNNSGLLHVANALGVPTVSTMGPANPDVWWPEGDTNSVVRKDIKCIGCGKGYCRIKTHDCMNMITVDEMYEAANTQLQRLQS